MNKKYNFNYKIREYTIWISMKKRCKNPNDKRYKDYGAKGIKVCDSWASSFLNFLNDMGISPTKKHSLDRIDNNGDYCPENCRWATAFEQSRNTSRNIIVEYKGKKIILKDYCMINNLNYGTVTWRIRHGVPLAMALTPTKRKTSPIIWNGIIYERKDLAKHLNLNLKTLNYRIRSNLKLDGGFRSKKS